MTEPCNYPDLTAMVADVCIHEEKINKTDPTVASGTESVLFSTGVWQGLSTRYKVQQCSFNEA